MAEHLPYNDETLMNYVDGELGPDEAAAIDLQLQADPHVLVQRVGRHQPGVVGVALVAPHVGAHGQARQARRPRRGGAR